MPSPSQVLLLDPAERAELFHLARSPSEEARIVQRARLVLGASAGESNQQISRDLRLARKQVILWRARYCLRRLDPHFSVRARLEDEPRSGRPALIQPEQWVNLMALATSTPASHGVPITHWTQQDLARVAHEEHIVPKLHPATIGRFLSRATLQPHRVKEWMNRKHDPQFDERAHKVKELLTQATSKDRDLTHVVLSFDEKTGMQAKERIAAGQLMSAGQVERMEFEYARHGVRLLFGTLEVSTGKVSAVMSERRTSEDTARVLEQELGLRVRQGARRVTLILDQLNTHMSLEVVEVVARLSGVPLPDSKELQTMKQRKEWLEKEDRKVVFCFTPKHASWLNPIEIWFGVLVGKVLRRGSFESTKDLDAKVLAFVDYFNQKLAHPFHFKGWKSRQKAA